MILDKYIDKMSDERFYYTYVLIELVRRGYRRQDARKMITESKIIERCVKNPTFFNHYTPEYWADYVIDKVNKIAVPSPRIAV